MWQQFLLIILFSGVSTLPLMAQQPSAKSQPDMPLRIEIPVHSVNETYRLIPCGTHGIILFFRSQEAVDGARTNWYFTCYDTNLLQVWVKSVPLYNDQDFKLSEEGKDTLALLFITSGKTKSGDFNFEILRIVPATGLLILNTGVLDPLSLVETFSISRGRAWLGTNYKGAPGKITNVRLDHGSIRTTSLGTGNLISVLWMEADSTSPTVTAIVSRQISKKMVEYYLVRYDTLGVIKREVPLNLQQAERVITTVSMRRDISGKEILFGTYGQRPAGSSQKNLQTDESTGLFTCVIENGVQKSITFYNYLELKSADAIVGEDDIMNLKKKALKKKKALNEYSLDFSVLQHDIKVENGQYLLTTEIYAPQYHTENFTDFDFYGRPYTNSYSVFDGYRFFNALVTGFNGDGNLLWDNNIEFRNLISRELTPKLVLFPNKLDMVLCYISDGKVGSKIINEGNVTEKLDFTILDRLYPEDKIIEETKGIMNHWYGNYFISSGYQDIKNISLETNNKRLVFYFSKLRFD